MGFLQPPPSAFQYESKSRVSAEAALRHPYFRSLGERVLQLEDSECEGDAGGPPWTWERGSGSGRGGREPRAQGPGLAEQLGSLSPGFPS